jgi:hypothetical protein
MKTALVLAEEVAGMLGEYNKGPEISAELRRLSAVETQAHAEIMGAAKRELLHAVRIEMLEDALKLARKKLIALQCEIGATSFIDELFRD